MVEQDLQNLDTGHSRIFLELPVEVLWSFLSKRTKPRSLSMVLFLLGGRQPALPEVLAAMQGSPPR